MNGLVAYGMFLYMFVGGHGDNITISNELWEFDRFLVRDCTMQIVDLVNLKQMLPDGRWVSIEGVNNDPAFRKHLQEGVEYYNTPEYLAKLKRLNMSLGFWQRKMKPLNCRKIRLGDD